MSIAVARCFKLFIKLLNFKGNSDIERYQMANKKIPFKYTRPVEDWLQEKGNPSPDLNNVFHCYFYFIPPVMPSACSLRSLRMTKPPFKIPLC